LTKITDLQLGRNQISNCQSLPEKFRNACQ